MSSFPLLLPGNRNERAAVQCEVERAFAFRTAQANSGWARKVLAWAEPGNLPRPGDKLETEGQQGSRVRSFR